MERLPSTELVARFDKAMRAGRDGDWSALEVAHLLSQPWARMHVRSHLAMLRLAWREHDGREVGGQIVRVVVAGPGSFTGRYPKGNTGRARVSMWTPMPVPDELAERDR